MERDLDLGTGDRLLYPFISSATRKWFKDIHGVYMAAQNTIVALQTYQGDKEELFNRWLTAEGDHAFDENQKAAIGWVLKRAGSGEEDLDVLAAEINEQLRALSDFAQPIRDL